jgi:hypothetical protein
MNENIYHVHFSKVNHDFTMPYAIVTDGNSILYMHVSESCFALSFSNSLAISIFTTGFRFLSPIVSKNTIHEEGYTDSTYTITPDEFLFLSLKIVGNQAAFELTFDE